MAIACKICIMTKGLRGADLASLPQTQEELNDHLEAEHHMVVVREGETDEQAHARVLAKNGPCIQCDAARAAAHRN